MLRQVLQDYRAQFKENLHSLTVYDYFWWFYIGVLYPLMFLKDNLGSGWWRWACYFTYFLATGMAAFLSQLYPNEMSKTLLLCPMEEEDRRQYMKTGYWIRVLFPAGIYTLAMVVIGLVLAGSGQWNLAFLGQELWLVPALSVLMVEGTLAMNMNCRPLKDKRGTKTYPGHGHFGTWRSAIELTTLMFGFFMLVKEDSGGIWVKIVVILLFVGIQTALCVKILRTYGKEMLEQAVCYERIPGLQEGAKRV